VSSSLSARRISTTIAAFFLFLSPVLAQQINGPCAKDVERAGTFLHCVADAADYDAKNHDPAALLKEPMRGYLQKLETMLGYTGDPADLGVLKRISLDLKQAPEANRDAVDLLDKAIASYVAEVRPAMSREIAATGVGSGTDIYPRFVEQRLNFLLDPNRINFYDRGPFEITIRASLANTLEAKYFLSKGDRDDNLLRQEIRALKDVYKIMLAVPAGESRRRLRLNGNLFWQASIFFALGDKEQLSQTLRDLVYENRDFGLENRQSGHVYIYKVFDLPFSIVVEGVDQDGKPHLTSDDPYILNRFYNPGQLALTLCNLVKSAGQNGIQAFSNSIRDLAFNDFYVVIASGNKPDKLRQFGDALIKSISDGERASRRDVLLQEIGKKETQLSHKMENGATACGVEQRVREKIFPPFDFKLEVRHIETLGKQPEHLTLGGNIDADQANKLAEFFNEAVSADPMLSDQARNLGVESVSYTARVRIE
jgi:predicted Rdx family selenoprotein